MKRLILALYLVALSPLAFAQKELNFQTIDIAKNGDTSVSNFISGAGDYVFFANNKLTKLNKQTKQYSFVNTGNNNLRNTELISDGINHFFNYTDGKLLLKYAEDGQVETIKSSFYFNKIIKVDDSVSYILYSDSYDTTNPRLAKISNGAFEDVLNLETDSKLMGISIENNKVIVLYVNKISITNLTNNEVVNFSIENTMNYGNQIPNFNLDIVDSKLYFKSVVNYQTTVKSFDLNTYSFQNTTIPNYTLGSVRKVGDTTLFIYNYNLYIINSNSTISRIDLGNYSLNYYSTLDISHNNSIFTFIFSNQTGSYETAKIDILTGQLELISYLNDTNFLENNSFGDKQYYIKGDNLEVYNISNGERQVLTSNIKVEKILSVSNDEIILHATTPKTGAEIFAYNNVSSSIEYFGDLNNSPNTNPKAFINVGNKVFYQALSDNLYVTEGTEETTRKVFDVSLNNNTLGNLMKGIEFKGKLYFSGIRPGINSGSELWFSDGTPEGTQEIEINTTTAGPHSVVSGFRNFIGKGENRFYFVGNTPHQGDELWTSDGTREGTRIVKEFSPGSNSTYFSTTDDSIIGDLLYFLRPNYLEGSYVFFDLWVTDGSEQGTRKLNRISEVVRTDSFNTEGIIAVTDNYVYYTYSYQPENYFLFERRLYRYNLNTAEIEFIDKVKSNKTTKLTKDNIYYTKDNNYYSYNIHTGVKILIEENFGYLEDDMMVLKDCGNYLLYGDTDYSLNFRDVRIKDKTSNENLMTLTHGYFNNNNTLCISNKPLLFQNSAYDSVILGTYFTIENNQVSPIPIKLDDIFYDNIDYMGEMIYNEELNKILGSTIFQTDYGNELVVSNVDFIFLNTTENSTTEFSSKKNNVVVYPNPTNGKLNVKISKGELISYSLYDMLGREIKMDINLYKNHILINLSNFSTGVYNLNLITSEGRESKKIIIK